MESLNTYITLIIFQVVFIITALNCHEICDIHATIIRRIENEGFHRDVHSLVEIVTGHSTLWGDCMVILDESMPSGLYVNPDQLADMRRVGQVKACPVGVIDIEAPESSSFPHAVQVYSNLNRTENLLSASVMLPFHVRYHSPVAHGGYTTVELKAPSLLLRCQNNVQCVQGKRIKAPCTPCSKEMCQWINLSYKTNSPSIMLYVPVGNLSHQGLVTIVTLLVTCGGCIYILSAVAEAWPNSYNISKLRCKNDFPQKSSTLSQCSGSCNSSCQLINSS